MEVLRDKDRELYDKLVRLAGGNSAIVIKCLSNRKRQYVTLRDLIEEIKSGTRMEIVNGLKPRDA